MLMAGMDVCSVRMDVFTLCSALACRVPHNWSSSMLVASFLSPFSPSQLPILLSGACVHLLAKSYEYNLINLFRRKAICFYDFNSVYCDLHCQRSRIFMFELTSYCHSLCRFELCFLMRALAECAEWGRTGFNLLAGEERLMPVYPVISGPNLLWARQQLAAL